MGLLDKIKKIGKGVLGVASVALPMVGVGALGTKLGGSLVAKVLNKVGSGIGALRGGAEAAGLNATSAIGGFEEALRAKEREATNGGVMAGVPVPWFKRPAVKVAGGLGLAALIVGAASSSSKKYR